jgi:predicted enzyme related to lactoylglutathione lyase
MTALRRNIVGWFEIPVTDMDRAVRFYETVFSTELYRNQMGPLEMAWFPEQPDAPGSPGSLVKHPDFYKPSTDGTLVYFSSPSGDIANEEKKIEAAGGTVLSPKILISEEIGYMNLFIDTEGNRVAMHSKK